jgi:SAM-dependent methyltransferase
METIVKRINLNKLYTESWFQLRPKLAWRTEPFCQAVWRTLGPFKTVVDLGCGIGEFIAHFNRVFGIYAVGFEGCENCLTYITSGASIYMHDLREPLNWGDSKFDLCMCLELAEHIEPEYVDVLIDSCCSTSEMILFTAAKPGQGGLGHVNLQPEEYWVEKFKTRNYTLRADKVSQLRYNLTKWKDLKGIKAYYQNAMVFEKWI